MSPIPLDHPEKLKKCNEQEHCVRSVFLEASKVLIEKIRKLAGPYGIRVNHLGEALVLSSWE